MTSPDQPGGQPFPQFGPSGQAPQQRQGGQPGQFGPPGPAQQPQPTGQLLLELRKPWGSMGMVTPAAEIDGRPIQIQWGSNPILLPAGTHQVFVSCSYLWTYGKATDQVPVTPGQQVVVHYSPPMFTLMRGRLGPNRMPYGGMTLLIILLVVIVLLILIAVLGAVFS